MTRQPSLDDLKALLPRTWTHHSDLLKARRSVRPPRVSTIRARASYFAVPRPVWERMGSPTHLSAFFVDWDLMLVPSDEVRLQLTKHFARIVYSLHTGCLPRFSPFIRLGDYLPEHYTVQTLYGLRMLRVKDCSVLHCPGGLEHWKKAQQRLEPQPPLPLEPP